MSLIYITGVSASGKSTILHALALRGFATYDEDLDNLSAWYQKDTDQEVKRPKLEHERTKMWYADHEWRISRQKLELLASKHSGGLAFLCGSTLSDKSVWDLFDRVICLTIDEKTLRHRLLTRKNNDWGKAPTEMEHVLAWREPWEKLYRERGVTMIDATQPLANIVDQIVAITREDNAT